MATDEAPALGPSPAGAGTTAIECDGLVVRYGETTAVNGLSFDARSGEVLALLGPNGAGKTSTVETLEGYRRPAGGRVRVLGLDPTTEHGQLVGRIGVMLQRGGIYPMLSPRRAVELFAAYYPRPQDPVELLDLVGLRSVAATPWRNLSGGEQQRLSLALALVGRPEVVFLDEPTAGVDPEGRLGIREVIAELRGQGVAVLLTTHELAEAARLADRVVIIHHGRAAASGTLAELAAQSGAAATVRFGSASGLDVRSLSATVGVAVTEESAGRYRLDDAGSPQLTAALASWLAERDAPLSDLQTARSLEETYLSIVGSAAAAEPEPEPLGTGRRRGGRP